MMLLEVGSSLRRRSKEREEAGRIRWWVKVVFRDKANDANMQ
jgi:hypothetical protein